LVNLYQRTIKNPTTCFGIGVHSGKKVSMTLLPAKENTGIVFKRTDIKDIPNEIPAAYNLVTETMLGTTLTNACGAKIATVEHLMAAIWGCGIDNLIIEIDGPEVPIMDGSSDPFVQMIEATGYTEQSKPRKIIEILKEVKVSHKDAHISISPANSFSITMEIDFKDKFISKQSYHFDSKDLTFKAALSRARTFGFIQDVEKLRAAGLALGGSLENAIVIDGDRILNEEGLRFSDEFARHKALDIVGDLFLAGHYIKGHVKGVQSGHHLNNLLLRELFKTPDAWRYIDITSAIPNYGYTIFKTGMQDFLGA
jgi:UDP-3-O-[3-hydroxymyristoyl] N-acetylglucosamine deacetylase